MQDNDYPDDDYYYYDENSEPNQYEFYDWYDNSDYTYDNDSLYNLITPVHHTQSRAINQSENENIAETSTSSENKDFHDITKLKNSG